MDDHNVLRQGLRNLLESYGDIEVVGEAGDGLAGIELAQRARPDVVVIDIDMPRMNGIEATRRFCRGHRRAPPPLPTRSF